MPPFPPPDADGNFPAIEATDVSIARSMILDRRRAGLTRRELARLAGVRLSTIERGERVEKVPGVRSLEKIERALQVEEHRRATARTEAADARRARAG